MILAQQPGIVFVPAVLQQKKTLIVIPQPEPHPIQLDTKLKSDFSGVC